MSTTTTRWKEPRHFAYNSYEAIVRSFLNWPRYLIPTPTSLSAVCFFYSYKTHITQTFLLILLEFGYLYANLNSFLLIIGTGDKTICFRCGVGLQEWMKSGYRWLEHGAWSPFCTYVSYIKGTQFMKDCRIKRNSSSTN